MDFSVPSPPASAHTLALAIWLGTAMLPLLMLRRLGLRKTARYSLFTLLGMAPLTLPTIWMMRANAVQVAEGRIQVQAGYFYEADRALGDFDLGRAVAGARRDMPQARLTRRLNGIGARGYAAGWFALAEGGLAFVMLTDPQRALFLPAKTGASLLISVDEPARVLGVLRAQSGA